jgi:hypothetical protein
MSILRSIGSGSAGVVLEDGVVDGAVVAICLGLIFLVLGIITRGTCRRERCF